MKRKKQFIAKLLAGTYLLAPTILFADATPGTIGAVLEKILEIIQALIPIILGLAFITFLWGMYKYISAASEGGKEEGRNIIIYGIIGLFVMVAVWGLVKVITTTFSIDADATFIPPGLPTQ